MKTVKICKNCGKEYEKNRAYSETQWAFSKFCGYACASDMKRKIAETKPQQERKCSFCGKTYLKKRSLSPNQWGMSKFCSSICAGKSKRKYDTPDGKNVAYRRRKGMSIKVSQEHKDKIARLTKLAMQRPEVQEKIRQPREALSLEHRIKLSNAHAGKMPQNMMYASGNSGCYANVQRGDYDINGTTMYFRSKWEANYALFLDFLIDHKEIVKWEFEPDTFVFEKIQFGTRSYTPDFKVFNNNGTISYHEVKGYMDSKSKTKLKRMKRYYPKIEVILIDSGEYNLLKKQIGKLCNFY